MSTSPYPEIIESIFTWGKENHRSDLARDCFDMVEAFVAAIDPAGNIILLNKMARFLLGDRNDDAIGKNFIQHFLVKQQHSKMQIFFDEMLSGAKDDTGYQEYRLREIDGQKRVLKLRCVPISDMKNNVIGIFATGSDITAEKQKTRRLADSKDEAHDLNLAKSEFLARVAHEIRTPLNAIMGFTEQLMQTRLDEQQEEYVHIIDRSSEHLLSLINDVLILSKIEARELNLEKSPFKLVNTINYVYESLRVRADAKNLQLKFDVDSRLDRVLIGDPFRLRQVLINMLNNALKFTHKGSVELKCYLQAETNEKVQVRFDVKDTGIGIRPDKLDIIFEQFKQADSNIAKKYGGTGLGLTICRNLIELQNGSLSVTSQLGKGTTFTFTLPFRKGRAEDLIPEDLGTVNSEKLKDKRILLVDDDAVNRLLGKTILGKFKCRFDIANNGEEAMEKLQDSEFDLILLDIHLPDVSGIDVAKFVRTKLKDRSTKIIAITAAVIQHDVKRFYKAGMDDLLLKPFKEVVLFNKICEVLQIKTSQTSTQKTEIILQEDQIDRPFNLAALKKMAGNDGEFANQMLLTFIDNSENSIHHLKQYLKDGNWEQIGETAHRILPSYRHLEVNAVVSKLLELKTKTQVNPDLAAVPAMVKAIISDMEELVTELRKEIQNT